MDDDNNELPDLSALINILLPLDLYKQTPFPSEQSFDRLRHLIRAHFQSRSITSTVTTPPLGIITQDFIFSICNILWNDNLNAQSQGRTFPREKILPCVLRRIKLWRLLPADEKNLDYTVERLALDLAGLVNCRASIEGDGTSHNSRKRLRVRWIGSDSEYADDVYCSTFSNDEPAPGSPAIGSENGVAAAARRSDSQSGPTHVCLNILHLQETAAFRSGCCCCRQPRTSISTSHASSLALLPSVHSKPKEIPDSQSSIKSFPSIPKDTPKTSSQFVDENVPPISSSTPRPITKDSKSHSLPNRRSIPANNNNNNNNVMPSARSKHLRLSAISTNTTPSRLSTSYAHMISRSSHSRISSSGTQALCPSGSNTQCPTLPPVRSSSSSPIGNTNIHIQTPRVVPSSSAISAHTRRPKSVIKAMPGLRVSLPSSASQAQVGTLKHDGDKTNNNNNNKTTAPGSRSKPIIPASSRVLRPRRGQV